MTLYKISAAMLLHHLQVSTKEKTQIVLHKKTKKLYASQKNSRLQKNESLRKEKFWLLD